MPCNVNVQTLLGVDTKKFFFNGLKDIDLIILLNRNLMPTVGTVFYSPFVIVFSDREKLRKSCFAQFGFGISVDSRDIRLK